MLREQALVWLFKLGDKFSHGGEKQGKSHFGQNQISQNSERCHDGA